MAQVKNDSIMYYYIQLLVKTTLIYLNPLVKAQPEGCKFALNA